MNPNSEQKLRNHLAEDVLDSNMLNLMTEYVQYHPHEKADCEGPIALLTHKQAHWHFQRHAAPQRSFWPKTSWYERGFRVVPKLENVCRDHTSPDVKRDTRRHSSPTTRLACFVQALSDKHTCTCDASVHQHWTVTLLRTCFHNKGGSIMGQAPTPITCNMHTAPTALHLVRQQFPGNQMQEEVQQRQSTDKERNHIIYI